MHTDTTSNYHQNRRKVIETVLSLLICRFFKRFRLINNQNIFFFLYFCGYSRFSDLKSLTEQELWKSFDDHYEIISNLFSNYLKQTDATVIRANDYNHFDMISLLSTDQFSVLLDILFDKLVKIGEFGEINVSETSLDLKIVFFFFWFFKIFQKISKKFEIFYHLFYKIVNCSIKFRTLLI